MSQTLTKPKLQAATKSKCPQCGAALKNTIADWNHHREINHKPTVRIGDIVWSIPPSEAFFMGKHYHP